MKIDTPGRWTGGSMANTLVPGGGLPDFIFRQVTALRDLVETARLHVWPRPTH